MGQFSLFNALGRFNLFNAHRRVQFVQCRWDGSICSMQMRQFNLFSADGTVHFVVVLLWKGSVLFSMLRKSSTDGVSGEASGKPPV